MGSEAFAISAAGKRVAKQIVTNLGNLGFRDRGVKHGDGLMLLEGTNAPAVLVGVCFVDSEADIDLYRRVGVSAVATAIAAGLDLKSIPKSPTPLPTVGPAAPESTPVPVKPIPVDASTIFYKPGDAINWLNGPGRISKHFIVSEVTQKDPRRIPKRGSREEAAILRLALELDKVREAWGKPLVVTSWYRPPAVNKAVGGVRDSRHISGMAVDIAPIDPSQIYEFQRWIDARWYGALGYGARKGFVHLDMRPPGGGFMTGGKKGVRWNY
jgi:putative chitinase